VKNILKSVNIWQNYKQESGSLMHFVRLARLKDEDFTRRLVYGEKQLLLTVMLSHRFQRYLDN